MREHGDTKHLYISRFAIEQRKVVRHRPRPACNFRPDVSRWISSARCNNKPSLRSGIIVPRCWTVDFKRSGIATSVRWMLSHCESFSCHASARYLTRNFPTLSATLLFPACVVCTGTRWQQKIRIEPMHQPIAMLPTK